MSILTWNSRKSLHHIILRSEKRSIAFVIKIIDFFNMSKVFSLFSAAIHVPRSIFYSIRHVMHAEHILGIQLNSIAVCGAVGGAGKLIARICSAESWLINRMWDFISYMVKYLRLHSNFRKLWHWQLTEANSRIILHMTGYKLSRRSLVNRKTFHRL